MIWDKSGMGQSSEADRLQHYQRTFEAELDQVLQAPEFAALYADQPWWMQLAEWLNSAFYTLMNWIGNLPGWLWWVLLIWLILSLLAIVGHTLWTLATGFGLVTRRSRPDKTADTSLSGLLGQTDLTYEQVAARIQPLLDRGEELAAIRHIHLAALLWLEQQGVIAYHAAWTNAQYLQQMRQAGRQTALLRLLGELTAVFDRCIYGRLPAGRGTCQTMLDKLRDLQHASSAQ